MLSGVSEPFPGASRLPPVSTCPFLLLAFLSTEGPLRSTGVTRLPHYYGPLRYPAGPSWPSRVPGWRVRATDRASRVAAVSLFRACHRQYPGGNDQLLASLASQPLAAFPDVSAGRLPHQSFRGLLNVHCTLWPARSLNHPRRSFSIEVLQSVSFPPRTAPTATGWSDSCRADLCIPLETQRLSTAHEQQQVMPKIPSELQLSARSSDKIARNFGLEWRPHER